MEAPMTKSRSHFTEWAKKTGRASSRQNLISAVGGMRIHNLLIDSQASSLSYHCFNMK